MTQAGHSRLATWLSQTLGEKEREKSTSAIWVAPGGGGAPCTLIYSESGSCCYLVMSLFVQLIITKDLCYWKL